MAEQEGMQTAQQLVEQAAQAARQATQQAEQAVQAAQQAARAVGAESSAATISTEITPASIGLAWGANNKRAFDEFLNASLESIRANQAIANRVANNSASHDERLHVLSEKSLERCITHSADLDTQKIRHNDLAIDRTWNIDEVAALVAKTPVFQDAIAAAVAQAAQQVARQQTQP